MIRGYPECASVAPGDALVLHVASDAPRFRVRFLRFGDGPLLVAESAWFAAVAAPESGAGDDWNWPAYSFDVPPDWQSGVYLAQLCEDDAARPLDLACESGAALFVVRGPRRARMLYTVPLATYHAYTLSGGGCFYVNPPRSQTPPGSRVSLHRPGGGIGAVVHGAPDVYDLRSPRSTFAHYDAPFIRWLARCGDDVEFCADYDVHRDPALCESYALVLSVGHDEYWSEGRRDATEGYVARGGNAAFFGANLCWWRISYVDGDSALVCHQGGPRGALDHWWAPTGAARPENALTGVSYRFGGGWWDGSRKRVGYVVRDPAHWAFAGTGLREHETFGAESTPPLVGYECDGAPLERDPRTGRTVLAADARRAGTPPTFELLAVGELDAGWQERPPNERGPGGTGLYAATMGTFTNGGTTFTAGTTDWAQVLAAEPDGTVARVTRNVIDRLAYERS